MILTTFKSWDGPPREAPPEGLGEKKPPIGGEEGDFLGGRKFWNSNLYPILEAFVEIHPFFLVYPIF